jgi:hypothetical protein
MTQQTIEGVRSNALKQRSLHQRAFLVADQLSRRLDLFTSIAVILGAMFSLTVHTCQNCDLIESNASLVLFLAAAAFAGVRYLSGYDKAVIAHRFAVDQYDFLLRRIDKFSDMLGQHPELYPLLETESNSIVNESSYLQRASPCPDELASLGSVLYAYGFR